MTSPVSGTDASLSDRELQIIELVADGLTNEKIAEKLQISKRTVDNHISNILEKTKTENRVALVRWALQWGKVCLDKVNCCVLPPSGEEAIFLPREDSHHSVPLGGEMNRGQDL